VEWRGCSVWLHTGAACAVPRGRAQLRVRQVPRAVPQGGQRARGARGASLLSRSTRALGEVPGALLRLAPGPPTAPPTLDLNADPEDEGDAEGEGTQRLLLWRVLLQRVLPAAAWPGPRPCWGPRRSKGGAESEPGRVLTGLVAGQQGLVGAGDADQRSEEIRILQCRPSYIGEGNSRVRHELSPRGPGPRARGGGGRGQPGRCARGVLPGALEGLWVCAQDFRLPGERHPSP